MPRSRCLLAPLLSVLAIVAATGSAGAQSALPADARHRLFGGATLVSAAVTCIGSGDRCDGAPGGGPALGVQLGYLLAPRVGALLDLERAPFNDLSYYAGTVAVRYWPLDSLWLETGLGFGYVQRDGRGYDVPLGMLALGFEPIRRRHWAMGAEIKLAWGPTTEPSAGLAAVRIFAYGLTLTFF